MKLLTKEIEKRFKQLGNQDGIGNKAIVVVKFFSPFSNFTWWATEYDENTKEFFGLVQGYEVELGYFSLREFEDMNNSGQMKLTIERDMYWREKTLGEVKDEIN